MSFVLAAKFWGRQAVADNWNSLPQCQLPQLLSPLPPSLYSLVLQKHCLYSHQNTSAPGSKATSSGRVSLPPPSRCKCPASLLPGSSSSSESLSPPLLYMCDSLISIFLSDQTVSFKRWGFPLSSSSLQPLAGHRVGT